MSSDWITGGELLDAGIQVFELTNAIREERISCTDPVSGKPVLDVNTSRAVPKYSTLSQALIAYREGCRRTGMSTNVEQHFLAVEERRGTALALTAEEEREYLAVARQADENCARVVLKEAVTYPAGTHQFDFDFTNHRNDVDGFIRTVRALLFSRAEVAAGLVIRHVPLTPGQDWLGNPDPLLNQRQIARPISAFDLLSRWAGASGESIGALSERLVRFLKHGALHLFEPRQAGPRILYTPSTKDAAAIEIDCAAAAIGGWTEESQAVNDLSGLFADMVEVEALEAQYDSLKPIASDNSGQEHVEVATIGDVEGETEEAQSKGRSLIAEAQTLVSTLKNQLPRPSNSEIAKTVDASFTGLTNPALGGLLADDGDIRSKEADKKRGRRARGHQS